MKRLAVLLPVLQLSLTSATRSCDCPLQDNLLYGIQSYADDSSYHSGMSLPEYICCNNEQWAEHSGFYNDVDFFETLEANGAADAGAKPTIFYDSTCGIPLFQAPVDRTFEEWKSESQQHGWPSFRTREIFSDNLVVALNGETKSVCGTHLGHNLPDVSGDRYCIDLVCMAGHPVVTTGNASANGTCFEANGASAIGIVAVPMVVASIMAAIQGARQ